MEVISSTIFLLSAIADTTFHNDLQQSLQEIEKPQADSDESAQGEQTKSVLPPEF
jgi:hypothetical protein